MSDPIQVVLDSVKRCRRTVLEMRAERWLLEWPRGHSEEPRKVPDYVREYEEAHALQSGDPVPR